MKKCKILLDELPLTDDKFTANDYSAKIIMSEIGENIFLKELCGKKIAEIDIVESVLKVRINFPEKIMLLKNLENDIKSYLSKARGIEKIIPLGMEKMELLYSDTEVPELVINFKEKKQAIIFGKVLKSFRFNINDSDSLRVVKWTNRKVVLASSTQMKIFKKTKSQIKTIILFVTKQINLTPNTIFKQKTLKFLRSYKFHKRNKSGIEIFLVCTNQNSDYFDDVFKRKAIFKCLNRDEILNSLDFVLSNNFLVNEIFFTEENKVVIKKRISISYDDYYPNKVITQIIARQIEKNLGIQVDLVKTNFKKVTEEADFRLLLLFDNFSEIGLLYYLLGLISPLKNNLEHFKEYHNLVDKYFTQSINKTRFEENMCDINSKEALFFPIGSLDSNYLINKTESIYK